MLLGYVRVSTTDQATDDRTSLADQERVIKGVAMIRGVGTFDMQIYSDPGISGAIPLRQRPAGERLMADAVRGDVIVASKLDRMFRDTLDAQVVLKELQERGVDLILHDIGSEPIAKGALAKLFFTIVSAFADMERCRIAERMADGRRGKKDRGGHIGGLTPYGFRKIGTGREALLEPRENEQNTIRLIARLSKNHGPGEVVRKLTQQQMFARNGKPFKIVQVQRIAHRAARIVQ